MASDRDLVSSEKHELNYLLDKWGKRLTRENREILTGQLKAFKTDSFYTPHKREDFYRYVIDKSIRPLLEDKAEIPGISAGEVEPGRGAGIPQGKSSPGGNIQSPLGRGGAIPAGQAGRMKSRSHSGRNWILGICLIMVLALIFIAVYRFQIRPSISATAAPAEEREAVSSPPATLQEAGDFAGDKIEVESDLPASENREEGILSHSITDILAVNLPLYFKKDSSQLLPGEEIKLQVIADALKGLKEQKVLVAGHAAKVGLPEGEKRLSQQRADWVRDYLIRRLPSGSALRFQALGYGSDRQVAIGTGEAELALNRRVEISLALE